MADLLDRGVGIDFSNDFIRGAARIFVASPAVKPHPSEIDDVVRMETTAVDEVQTIMITGTPTGGTFTLAFKGYSTTAIAFNAAASAVDAALELLPTVGAGNVTVSGGPGPAAPYVVTFAGTLAGQDVPIITASHAFTGGTTPAIAVAETTAGYGQYDAQSGWTDLGPTKGGIRLAHNNTEEELDVDQIQAVLLTLPVGFSFEVATSLSKVSLENLQRGLEGGDITVDGTTGERHLPIGAPKQYTIRRVAVVAQGISADGLTPGKIRMWAGRRVSISPQEKTLEYNKTGDQQTIPVTLRHFADTTVADVKARFGEFIEQA